ncbi:MAG: TonB-dependent receptor [Saprospiraceae bacterium]|nr:TonB-dependent receptor [Saprospiraceae bacterium]
MRSYLMICVLILLGNTMIPLSSMGKTYTFSVKVVDEQNAPLQGVNIYTSDYTFTGQTNESGELLLEDLEENSQIVFSHIAYVEVKLSAKELNASERIVRMKLSRAFLETITVVGRREESISDLPYQLERISAKEIAFTNPPTTADALSQHAGLFVQKSQLGGGSPIIRGFEANRVLLVVDGVRMNNAIYRSGHLQNAITLDNGVLSQIEVIYGPGSLTYGSDALGGVIHFKTKTPPFGQLGEYHTTTHFFSRYASATHEKTAQADIELGWDRWASLTSVSFSDFGDLRAGDRRPNGLQNFGKNFLYIKRNEGEDQVIENLDPNIQRNIGYSQLDILQKVRFQPNNSYDFIANFQFSTSSNVARYDRLTELVGEQPKFAEWYYGPQTRALTSLKARLLKPSNWYDRASVIAAYQYIEEDRYQRNLNSDWREQSLVDVHVFSLTADFDTRLKATNTHTHDLNYGIELTYNSIFSASELRNLKTNTSDDDVNARYPSSGSHLQSNGAFLNYRWKKRDSSLVFNAGMRYSASRLFAQFSESDPIEWPAHYIAGLTSTNDALTWAIGLNYRSAHAWQFRCLSGTAFRSPNIDDFAKFREKGNTVSVPNVSLQPEMAWTTEITIGKQLGNDFLGAYLEFTAFYTYLDHAIVRQEFELPNGDDFFISNGDSLFVLANVNADQAQIWGLSANAKLHLGKHWQWRSGLSWTKGIRTYVDRADNGQMLLDTLVPQGHIPPLYGRTSLRFAKAKWSAEAVIQYNAAKRVEDYAVTAIDPFTGVIDRAGTSDNIEQSPIDPITGAFQGTYAWTTYNIYGSYQINQSFSINAAVENITDIHYRTFSSGISAPGRNYIVSLRAKF